MPRRPKSDRPKRVPRLTVRGALDRRMSANLNSSLREIGEPRKYHWSRLCGFRVSDLQSHLERHFALPENVGMTWERFLAGEIDIDHEVPMAWFPYRSSSDLSFRDAWSLANLQPMWAGLNRGKRDRFAG